jgi:hypothetical protein
VTNLARLADICRDDAPPCDSLAVMKLASRLRSASAALVAHGADPRRIIDELRRDWPAMLAAVSGGEVRS